MLVWWPRNWKHYFGRPLGGRMTSRASRKFACVRCYNILVRICWSFHNYDQQWSVTRPSAETTTTTTKVSIINFWIFLLQLFYMFRTQLLPEKSTWDHAITVPSQFSTLTHIIFSIWQIFSVKIKQNMTFFWDGYDMTFLGTISRGLQKFYYPCYISLSLQIW